MEETTKNEGKVAKQHRVKIRARVKAYSRARLWLLFVESA